MKKITGVCLLLVVLAVLVGLHQVIAHRDFADFYELKDILNPGLTHEDFMNGLAVVALVLHLKRNTKFAEIGKTCKIPPKARGDVSGAHHV